ncbi:hypothetical protein H072_6165 [Dactylellina haptotyla CBS 200.50]|uniref:Peptidase A1 domain-containing protein n=1 Tax=Dactylellina haptotyla (strain CBS 200.50) TaxID=1284197 RepID=S8BXI6_DACHA|nr:hypothetical protein H072_6165 [Dactylellina haptotyla CBS 200.50]
MEPFLIFRKASYSTFATLTALANLACLVAAYNIPPLYLPPAIGSQAWYGPDGMWSALTFRVGNSPQQVNLIPTTNTNDLWTVSPTGCDSATWSKLNNQSVPSSCTVVRGGVFDTSKSSTWSSVTSALGFSEQRFFDMGLNVTVNYGTDTLRIGNGDALVLEDHLVANYADPEQFLTGIIGLSVANVTFDQQTTYKALLTTLYDQKKIPSQSWGYTAGAYYREKRVPCSVVLGGYDLDRFVLHDREFTLSPDLYAIAGLQNINATSSTSANRTLLSDPIQVYIDSTTPYYYFPESVCNSFAELFGLFYDSDSELYFYTSDQAYETAKKSDYTLSFTLTNNTDAFGQAIVLYIPFAAFDLSHQFYNGSSASGDDSSRPYFPIKRGSREDTYTLGRAFLQETYLIVDYYRVTFSVHQAWFNGNTGAYQNVVTITDPDTDNTSTVTTGGAPAATSLGPNESGSPPPPPGMESGTPQSQGGGGSKNGAIIGGAVAGGIVVIALIGGLIFLLLRRQKRHKAQQIAMEPHHFPSGADINDIVTSPVEQKPVEMGQTSPRQELPGKEAVSPQELEAEVPGSLIAAKPLPELDGTAINRSRGLDSSGDTLVLPRETVVETPQNQVLHPQTDEVESRTSYESEISEKQYPASESGSYMVSPITPTWQHAATSHASGGELGPQVIMEEREVPRSPGNM